MEEVSSECCLRSFVLLAVRFLSSCGRWRARYSSSRALSFLLFSSTRRSAIESFRLARKKGGKREELRKN